MEAISMTTGTVDEFTAEYEKEIQRQRFTIIKGGKKD